MSATIKLSPHFTLEEMVRSQTAERDPDLRALQRQPPAEVVESLTYLCRTTLEPLRAALGAPLRVNSGYRCRQLNRRVGGSPRSQHMVGEAADLVPMPVPTGRRADILQEVLDVHGIDLAGERISDVGLLFLVAAIHLEPLDVDQLIHEFGPAFLRPAWVHIAASRRQSRRRITVVGDLTNDRYVDMDLETALRKWAPHRHHPRGAE